MDILDILRNASDTEDKKTLELFSSITGIKQKGFLNKENALKILKWKSPRPLQNYESNSDEEFIEITKLAFDTQNEK